MKKDFYIYKCLREIHRLQQASFMENGRGNIILILNTPGSLEHFMVHTDPGILKLVFERLIDFTAKKQSKGSIEFGYKLGKEDQLSFYVKQPGSVLLDHAGFEEEFEAEAGLLAEISEELRPLGGKVWIAKGRDLSRFYWFTLDVQPPPAAADEHTQVVDAAYPDWSDKTILIVDDVKTNLILLETFLDSTGAKVIGVDNGLKAVNTVKKNMQIDFVLMDVRMPVLDGYEATRRIKLVKPWIPVVAISAYPASAESEKWQHAGCDAFLGKPLNFSKLLKIMESLLSKVKVRA